MYLGLATERLDSLPSLIHLSSNETINEVYMNNTSQEHLKSILDYSPETGVFKWKVYRSHNAKVGDVAGSIYRNSENQTYYRIISINNKQEPAHRLAYLYVTGNYPKNKIDHVDGDGLNNRIDNLRDVTDAENAKNKRLSVKNKSGMNGVSWDKANKKWVVRISANGKYLNIGRFARKGEAISVRAKADKEYGYHENHGLKLWRE